MYLNCECAVNDVVEFDEFQQMMHKHKRLLDRERELRDAFKVHIHSTHPLNTHPHATTPLIVLPFAGFLCLTYLSPS